MSAPIISVEGLSKKYQIGATVDRRFHTFRDAMVFKAQQFKQRVLHPRGDAGAGSSGSSAEFWALQDVTFDVEPGDRLGVVGRNGAGKSTLLKLLSRITVPTRGRIHIRGRTASLLEVGTGFHAELTGRENVFLNGAILGMSRAEIKKKFDEIVAFAGVERFLDTPVKRYSSGMYVRLAFAVGAHLDPDILIIDEVLAVGDTEFQKKCLGKMETVSREGRTILFVSHNLGAVQSLCNKGVLLDHGTLKYAGTAKDTINQYLQLTGPVQTGTFERDRFSDKLHAIQKVELLNAQMQPAFSFDFGEKMYVRITTNPKGTQPFGMELRLKNSKLEYLGYASSWISHTGGTGTYNPGDVILLEVPELALVEDTYYLDLFCRAPQTTLAVDYLFDLVNFKVAYARPEGSPVALSAQSNFGSVIFKNVSFHTPSVR